MACEDAPVPLGEDIDRVTRVVGKVGHRDAEAWMARWAEDLAQAVDDRDEERCVDRHIELLLFERTLLTPPARAAELEDLVTGLGFEVSAVSCSP